MESTGLTSNSPFVTTFNRREEVVADTDRENGTELEALSVTKSVNRPTELSVLEIFENFPNEIIRNILKLSEGKDSINLLTRSKFLWTTFSCLLPDVLISRYDYFPATSLSKILKTVPNNLWLLDKIHSLYLNGKMKKCHVNWLMSLVSVKSLKISARYVQEESTITIGSCLDKIDLSECSEMTDKTFKIFFERFMLSRFKEINLHGCSKITDVAFSTLLKTYRDENLTPICQKVATRDFFVPVDSSALALLNLGKIDLSGCDISDAGLIAIAKEAPRLQSIYLSGCHKITDEGFLTLAESCPLLARLDVRQTSISEGTLKILAEKYPHLKISH